MFNIFFPHHFNINFLKYNIFSFVYLFFRYYYFNMVLVIDMDTTVIDTSTYYYSVHYIADPCNPATEEH